MFREDDDVWLHGPTLPQALHDRKAKIVRFDQTRGKYVITLDDNPTRVDACNVQPKPMSLGVASGGSGGGGGGSGNEDHATSHRQEEDNHRGDEDGDRTDSK